MPTMKTIAPRMNRGSYSQDTERILHGTKWYTVWMYPFRRQKTKAITKISVGVFLPFRNRKG